MKKGRALAGAAIFLGQAPIAPLSWREQGSWSWSGYDRITAPAEQGLSEVVDPYRSIWPSPVIAQFGKLGGYSA